MSGLYFVGPVSALSFGPLFRFVAGADYTTSVVVRHLSRGVSVPAWRRTAVPALSGAAGAPEPITVQPEA